jgi:hypothetical protein
VRRKTPKPEIRKTASRTVTWINQANCKRQRFRCSVPERLFQAVP